MIDTSELRKLAVDLDKAVRVDVVAHKAVEVEARQMKDDWRKAVSGARALQHLPLAISYDMHIGLRGIEAEVGYDKRGQGDLGNIVEYGTSSEPPIRPAGGKVLRNGADRLEKYLAGVDPL